MFSIARLIVGAALLVAVTSPLAAEFSAETYHGSNCTRCHDTSVYTRENRQIQSYPMLESRVAGCDARFGEKLPPGGLAELVGYLNDSYYKFAK
mgnify:CR=1 FL=1